MSALSRLFTANDVDGTRILYVLALLGVALPFNSIASHYRNIVITYRSPHSWYGFIPAYTWHLYALQFLYSMEIMLAVTVYLYGFQFLFKSAILQRACTIIYGAALLVPAAYLYTYLYSEVADLLNLVHGFPYYLVSGAVDLFFAASSALCYAIIVVRLDAKKAA